MCRPPSFVHPKNTSIPFGTRHPFTLRPGYPPKAGHPVLTSCQVFFTHRCRRKTIELFCCLRAAGSCEKFWAKLKEWADSGTDPALPEQQDLKLPASPFPPRDPAGIPQSQRDRTPGYCTRHSEYMWIQTRPPSTAEWSCCPNYTPRICSGGNR